VHLAPLARAIAESGAAALLEHHLQQAREILKEYDTHVQKGTEQTFNEGNHLLTSRAMICFPICMLLICAEPGICHIEKCDPGYLRQHMMAAHGSFENPRTPDDKMAWSWCRAKAAQLGINLPDYLYRLGSAMVSFRSHEAKGEDGAYIIERLNEGATAEEVIEEVQQRMTERRASEASARSHG
jgi:hypothetical protein